MSQVAWILVGGFVILLIEVVYGVNEIVKHLDEISAQMKRIERELDVSKASSFAYRLRDWLAEIEREVSKSV
jgi:uncharacterized protein YoxC